MAYRQIKDSIKNLDEKLFKEISINCDYPMFYFEERTLNSLDKLDDEDLITRPELIKILKIGNSSNFSWMLYSNMKYYKKNIYNCCLNDYIEKHKIFHVQNRFFVRKKNVKFFLDFVKWWNEVKRIKKESEV